jgi:hypothetical protein
MKRMQQIMRLCLFSFLFITFSHQGLSQMDSPLVIKTEKIFNALNANSMNLLKDFYAQDVQFLDPLTSIKGLDTLTSYYQGLYQNVKTIRFDFHDAIVNDKTIVVMWTMYYQVDSLNQGKEIAVPGNSHIKFNDEELVYYHRDYFDVGTMVYEHVPVIGWLVNQVKSRLQKH